MGTNIHGKDSELAISTDGGSTYNTVAGVTDVSIAFSNEVAEVTDKDSAGHKEYISGLDDSTFDVTLRWEEDDTYQAAMETQAIAKTSNYFRLRPQVGAGNIEYTAKCFITEWSVESPTDDVISVSCTLQVSGALTSGTQV